MNTYSQLLYYIKSLGDNDVFVNTVTQNVGADLDTYKGNIFPILNIDVTGSSYPAASLISYTIELTCINLRDINKTIDRDKFFSNDNEVDNMNECQAVLNRIWLYMLRDFANNNITASDNPSVSPIVFEGKNVYDGWTLTFDVEVPKTTISIC